MGFLTPIENKFLKKSRLNALSKVVQNNWMVKTFCGTWMKVFPSCNFFFIEFVNPLRIFNNFFLSQRIIPTFISLFFNEHFH